MLIAARVAPLTRHIGLVPTAVVTHTEPFHVSKAIATLDYVSSGRAGLRVQISRPPARGRALRPPHVPAAPRPGDTGPAALGTSCSTRPPTTSRWCAGSGTAGRTTPRSATRPPAASSTATSCTTSTSRARTSASRARRSRPRPPQGQPLVAALGAPAVPYRLVARQRRRRLRHRRTTPSDAAGDRRARSAPSRPRPGAAGGPLHVFGDLVVFLGRRRAAAAAARGTGSTGSPARRTRSDAARLRRARRPQLADLLLDWRAAGLERLPAAARRSPHDLRGDHPRPGARAAAPRRVPHRLRGRHPARPARPRPPRQPLRRDASGGPHR